MKKVILISLAACLFATACNKNDLEFTKDGLPTNCAPNEIIYKTQYGYPIELKTDNSNFGGAKLVANLCEDGYCKYIFDADITQIPHDGFSGRVSLISMIIPNSVTSIGYDAFSDCSSLTSITIPDSVVSIGSSAFYGCTSLTSVTIPDSVTSFGRQAFYNCTGELIVNCNIPSASSYSNGAFYGSKFTKVTIGNSVTSIGKYAFYDCTSLASTTIPDNVTSIGYEAFFGCTGELIINSKIVETNYTGDDYPANPNNGWLYSAKFTKVTIGNSVTSIGGGAFYNCTSLKSVAIGNSVTSIGYNAFDGCTSLTSIIIPDSVTSIGEYAFYKCTSLKEVYCKPITPPAPQMASEFLGWNAFEHNASGRKIYVPHNSVSAYKTKKYWSDYASYIVGYDF